MPRFGEPLLLIDGEESFVEVFASLSFEMGGFDADVGILTASSISRNSYH